MRHTTLQLKTLQRPGCLFIVATTAQAMLHARSRCEMLEGLQGSQAVTGSE